MMKSMHNTASAPKAPKVIVRFRFVSPEREEEAEFLEFCSVPFDGVMGDDVDDCTSVGTRYEAPLLCAMALESEAKLVTGVIETPNAKTGVVKSERVAKEVFAATNGTVVLGKVVVAAILELEVGD